MPYGEPHLSLSEFGLGEGMFTYGYLRSAYRKGLRMGNLSKLRLEDRALFRCALWIAKVRGCIRNMKLMARIATIIMKLPATFKAQAVRAGRARAEKLMACFQERGASRWAPEVFGWFKDQRFMVCLGVLAMNG